LEGQLAEHSEDGTERALARAALGLIYCGYGEVDRAITHYRECARALEYHPELAVEIGKLLLRSGQLDTVAPYLEAALLDDKTRPAAHVLLAQLHSVEQRPRQALQHLEAAHAMTPAWGHLLTMLGGVHEQLGDPLQAQAFLDRYDRQQSQLQRLADRVGGPQHG
jgi:tetratricopeptide (TPR) repeat protein